MMTVNVLIHGYGQCMDTDYKITIMEPPSSSPSLSSSLSRWLPRHRRRRHTGQPQQPAMGSAPCSRYTGIHVPHPVAHVVALDSTPPHRPPRVALTSSSITRSVMDTPPPHSFPSPTLTMVRVAATQQETNEDKVAMTPSFGGSNLGPQAVPHQVTHPVALGSTPPHRAPPGWL